MRPSRRQLLSALTVLAAAVACGKDSPTAPPGRVVITTEVTPPSLIQGQVFTVKVTATPPEGVRLTHIKVAVTGVMQAADSADVLGDGAATITRSWQIPTSAANGSITVVGTATTADGGTSRAETNIAVADNTAPSLSQYGIANDPPVFQPGDSIRVFFTASDNVGVKWTTVRISGAMTYADSVTSTSYYTSRSVALAIPPTATLGSSITVTITAGDGAGNKQTVTIGPRQYMDVKRPSVTASLNGRHGSSGFGPGDTLAVTVAATDNYKLARVGFRLGAPASSGDSVTVSTASTTLSRQIVIPASWSGVSSFTVFAVDSVGNRTELAAGAVTVDNRTRRAPYAVAVPGDVRDAAFGAKRGQVYLAVPSARTVRVVDIATGALPGDLTFANNPSSLDLSLGEDSLLVAQQSTPFVTAVSLSTGARGDIRVLDPADSRGIVNLRLMGNNVMLVSVTFAGSGYGGSIREYNLSTGAGRTRNTVTELVPIARSGNRQRGVALIDDSCCPIDGLVYDVASDSWMGRGTVSRYFVNVSADYMGTNFLVSGSRFDGSLSSLGTAAPAEWTGGASSINTDGRSAFWATSSGVVQRRFSDGALLDSWDLAGAPSYIAVSPDGLTLVAVVGTQAYIIDLW